MSRPTCPTNGHTGLRKRTYSLHCIPPGRCHSRATLWRCRRRWMASESPSLNSLMSLLPNEQTLMDRLRAEQRRGAFQAHSCGIEELQAIEVLEKRKKLGKGELSSIAFAMKIRQGVITDDRKAWQLAKDSGHAYAQTTPHLFSWLIFTGRLGDGDKDTVITQHIGAGRHIAQHLQTAYEIALQCRLNSTAKF
ncbi:hypothetical protein AZ34_14460 [Hylemonella gracilis str. Niagara R]|uniref:Uncharacterized protein n=2 Tax=Hylemonella gracilis TaxID=80880 RepID=A0A016XJY9_9BURK|nr:hypothetical protein AZ34_14460 [Hylemonella gracilis str. Niagara R]